MFLSHFPCSIHNDSQQVVAIKHIGSCIVRVRSLISLLHWTDLEDSDDDISEIQQEISHLAQCDSEYVTRYYGSFVKGYKLWIGQCLCSVGLRGSRNVRLAHVSQWK